MSKSRAWTWRQAILQSDLPGECRHVLLTLSCYMNDMGGSCFPSIETLVDACGKSRSTVTKYLALAKSDGWIQVEQVKMTRSGGDNRGWKRNEYSASWPDEDLNSDPDDFSGENAPENSPKGSPSHGPPSEKGSPSDDKGGPSEHKKVVRHTDPISPENQSTISPVLKQPCAQAQPIPERITNGELIIALARDRDNLGACRQRHLTLVTAIEVRDEIQGGVK